MVPALRPVEAGPAERPPPACEREDVDPVPGEELCAGFGDGEAALDPFERVAFEQPLGDLNPQLARQMVVAAARISERLVCAVLSEASGRCGRRRKRREHLERSRKLPACKP